MKKSKPLAKSVNVYFGPGVPGMVAKNEVYTGDPSGNLKKLINDYPYISELCSSTDDYPTKNAELCDKSSALYAVYKKAEKELSRR